MPSSKLSLRHIITPLLVMLLLIVVTGISGFEVTHTWEQAISDVNGQMTETVILNNMYRDLIQMSQTPDGQTDRIKAEWIKILEQMNTLGAASNDQGTITALRALQTHLYQNNKLDRVLLSHILQEGFFNRQLDKTQQKLQDLKNYTQSVTLMITMAMTFLGLILTAITAKDLIRMFVALKASRDLNVTIQEEERRRIAQDLHDGVVQELVDLKRNYTPEKVDHLVDNLRGVCHNLKPQILDDLGLAAAVEFLAQDLRHAGIGQVRIILAEEHLKELPKHYELPLFRVIQELLSNIKHHAHASHVNVTLVYDPKESPLLRCYVKDDGNGFEPQSVLNGKSTRMGLKGVQERIEQLGGQLVIQSRRKTKSAGSCGSTFEFSVPIQKKVIH